MNEEEKNTSLNSKRKTSQKIISWVLFFVVTPIILGLVIMRPILIRPAKIPLPANDKRLEFVPVDLAKTPFGDFSEQLFGMPLKLNWYKLCLDNKNEVTINDVKVQVPYDHDPEAGAMEMQINFRGGTNYKIYTPVNSRVCDYVKTEKAIADIVIEYRKPKPSSFDPTIKIVESNERGGTAVIQQSAFINNDKSTFTLTNIWSEAIYKLLIFAFGWIIVIVNIRDSWQIFDKRNNKK